MKYAKGFTLIELMIAVVILAIIIAVGVPMYGDYVTRGKVVEATSTLSSTRVQMEQYFQDYRTYVSTAGAPNCAIAMPQAPVVKYFTFTCQAPDSTHYTITASGTAGMTGWSYTIDQQNNKASAMTGNAATAGWTVANPNTCWVTKKGGIC